MNYLPERHREFRGPRDAAATGWRTVREATWQQKPLVAGITTVAVFLTTARRIRQSMGF